MATQDRTFTIQNTGDATLNLSGDPIVALSGTNAADFAVTEQPASTIASSGSDTFTIRFTPSASGEGTASVSIANDDADENPYTFSIKGLGVVIPEEVSSTATYVGTLIGQTTSTTFHRCSGGVKVTYVKIKDAYVPAVTVCIAQREMKSNL